MSRFRALVEVYFCDKLSGLKLSGHFGDLERPLGLSYFVPRTTLSSRSDPPGHILAPLETTGTDLEL